MQIRLKKISRTKLIEEVKKIKKIVGKKTKIIINDFPDIAVLLQCDGCHLGQRDPQLQFVKKKF